MLSSWIFGRLVSPVPPSHPQHAAAFGDLLELLQHISFSTSSGSRPSMSERARVRFLGRRQLNPLRRLMMS